MSKDLSPILVEDDKGDRWVVYEDDNAYRLVENLPKSDNGVVHVEASLLAKVGGWWYDTAQKRVEEAIDNLSIPWEELEMGEGAALEEEAPALSERLAKISSYMVRVGRERSRIDSQLHLAKEALDHAVQRLIAKDDSKATIAAKTATLISADKRLRNAKIEVMEGEALKKALDGISHALDTIWKTTSRVLAVRLKEPGD